MVHTSDLHVENHQPVVKKSNRKWVLLGSGCAVLLSCICLCMIGIGVVKWSGSVDSTANHSNSQQAVTAIAVKLDGGSPNQFLFVGNTQDPWMLPGGTYYIEAADEMISVYTVGTVTIPKAGADVNLGQRIASSKGENLPQRKSELILIANAISGIQNGMLTYLFIFSDAYTEPLFTSQREITAYDLETLRDSYEPILADEENTINALLALESRANSAMGTSTCPDVCAPQQGLLDSILTFFSEMHHVDNRAVNDILQGAAAMSPGEKADAFQYMTSSMTNGAQSFDELLQKLENGELNDQANRIRNSLMDEPTFVESLTITRKSNRPLLEIAHEEGAVLVEKGAQMEVDIVKQVLQTAFPGIERGFDYADKVNGWAEFIRTTYTDPAAGATQFASGQATNRIKNQLLPGLMDMGYGENQANEMAGYLSEQIVGQLTKQNPELDALAEQEEEEQEAAETEIVQITASPRPEEPENQVVQQTEADCLETGPVLLNGVIDNSSSTLTGPVDNTFTLQLLPCGGPVNGDGYLRQRYAPDSSVVLEGTYSFSGTCKEDGNCTGKAKIKFLIIGESDGSVFVLKDLDDVDWYGTYFEGVFEGHIPLEGGTQDFFLTE